MRALFAVSLVALSSAETPAEAQQSLVACESALKIATNQSAPCRNKTACCLKDFDKTLAAENWAKNCTNASSNIKVQTQTFRQTLTDLCSANQSKACPAALEIAENKSVQCLADKAKAGCCREDFDTTLAAENLAKGCTNASLAAVETSDITVKTQIIEAKLTAACAASKSFKYGKKAAIGLGIGVAVCLCCLCACCIGIIMKCVGGKKGGRTDASSSDEEEEDIE